MSKFKISVSLTIRAKDGECKFYRKEKLFFPPYPGLLVVFDNEMSNCVLLSSVEYNCEKELFLCHSVIENQKCLCNPNDECCVMTEDLVRDFTAHGWKQEGTIRWLKDVPLLERQPWQFSEAQLLAQKSKVKPYLSFFSEFSRR